MAYAKRVLAGSVKKGKECSGPCTGNVLRSFGDGCFKITKLGPGNRIGHVGKIVALDDDATVFVVAGR